MKIKTCILLGLLGLSNALHADALHWQNNSLTLLYGNGFDVAPSDQTTLTFEHVSGWSWGDLFLFMDATDYRNSSQEYGFYGEISPRLSYSKLSGQTLDAGPVKDVLLAATREFGKYDVETTLLGVGFDLELPGFDFFQLNLYRRMPDGSRDGESIQITPVWSMSWPVAGSKLVFDGFMDWNIEDDGTYSKNLHFNPQIKYDLSQKLGLAEKQLMIGFEYDYWSNKYGIEDSAAFNTDQSVFSFLLKSYF
jgi:nucleoside-specific outer membrane channel protein Tsx